MAIGKHRPLDVKIFLINAIYNKPFAIPKRLNIKEGSKDHTNTNPSVPQGFTLGNLLPDFTDYEKQKTLYYEKITTIPHGAEHTRSRILL